METKSEDKKNSWGKLLTISPSLLYLMYIGILLALLWNGAYALYEYKTDQQEYEKAQNTVISYEHAETI